MLAQIFHLLSYTCLIFKCIIIRLNVAVSVCMYSFELSSNYKKFIHNYLTRTTNQVGCMSRQWAISLIITLSCHYTFGRVYWVPSVGRIQQTHHLHQVVLLSVISSSHSSLKTLLHLPSICYKLVIAFSYLGI